MNKRQAERGDAAAARRGSFRVSTRSLFVIMFWEMYLKHQRFINFSLQTEFKNAAFALIEKVSVTLNTLGAEMLKMSVLQSRNVNQGGRSKQV